VGDVLLQHDESFIKDMMGEDVESVRIRRKAFRGDEGNKMGFALVTFRTEAAAESKLKELGEGRGPMPVREHKWRAADSANESIVSRTTQVQQKHECEGAGMPSLLEQLEPLTETKLRDRLEANGRYDREKEQEQYRRAGRLGRKLFLKEELARMYREDCERRTLATGAGKEIAAALYDSLLAELRKVVWPKKRSRKAVQADCYMVLGKTAPDAKFKVDARHEKLWNTALAVLEGVGVAATSEEFECTSMAVTKNFRGSPHVDAKDATYQFAASLGDFQGGELCVEENEGRQIKVVDTRRRLAKVDGRYVHWVKDFRGEERFSVIFFCLDETKRKEPTLAVYDEVT